MSGIDHSLLYEARQFTTGATVHHIKTWIFCYETSEPDSPRRKRYEQLLREFVATKKLILGIRIQAKVALDRGIELRRASTALDEAIKRHF
jgi:hypothetical protein